MSIEQSPVTAEWKMIVNFVLKLCPRFQVLASQFSGPGLPFKNAVVVGFSDKEVHPQAEPCRLSDAVNVPHSSSNTLPRCQNWNQPVHSEREASTTSNVKSASQSTCMHAQWNNFCSGTQSRELQRARLHRQRTLGSRQSRAALEKRGEPRLSVDLEATVATSKALCITLPSGQWSRPIRWCSRT